MPDPQINPFAQFDRPAEGTSAGANPFAQFDATPAQGSGVAANFAANFNAAGANLVGAPVDAATWLLNRIPGVNIQHPIMGSDFLKHNVLGAIGGTNGVAGNVTPPVGVISVKASTNIQYATSGYVSTGVTPMQYAIHIRLEGPF